MDGYSAVRKQCLIDPLHGTLDFDYRLNVVLSLSDEVIQYEYCQLLSSA